MYFECSECQALIQTQAVPPFICPVCGLAGVTFAPLDEYQLAQRLAEGDEALPVEAEFLPEPPRVEKRLYQVGSYNPEW
jgi:hypothetical protein